jgi:glucan-binding YG repeat protein
MMLSGIIAEDGSLYYYVDGLRNYAGLIEIGGSYYYVRGTGEVVNGRSYWITKTNGLMNEGSFEFAADGKMIIPEPVAVKNGIYRENGKLFYYVDGKPSYAGLIQYTGGIIEEDGTVTEGVYQNAYIYVRTSGELAVGSYWTTKHNDVMKAALYQFDESGVMINPAV